MTERADVVVVGLGAMGSAAAYQLAKRGVKVLGLDRFTPPHAMGSSHGDTRITRQAVGEGTEYVPLVLDSHDIWRELEAATGDDLLVACGLLVIAAGTGENSHHGMRDFVSRCADAARQFAIPHELLDGRAVARRFPQFHNLAGDERAYWEPGAGYVFPERCIAAQLRRARDLGADLRTGVEVRNIARTRDGVRVETSNGPVEAERAVVTAGAWTGPLLGDPFAGLLEVNRQVLYWYGLDKTGDYRAETPVFIWMHGATDTDYLYGFPPLPGEDSVKVATEQYHTATTPEAVRREVDPAEAEEMYRRHVEGRIAGASRRLVKAAACLYTVTPDRRFIIDRHPENDRMLVVSACSGHGFKHSAGIGKAMAEWIVDGRPKADLSPFSLGRFGAG